jgi:hypothetical protein
VGLLVAISLLLLVGMLLPARAESDLAEVRRAAEQGKPEAQLELGGRYRFGRGGVTTDYEQSLVWYKKAAAQGDAGAQFFVGVMCAQGKGVPKDYTQAVMWYKRAAGQGDGDAQFNLGVMYANGNGVPQNVINAYAWFSLAADQGVGNALELRDRIAHRFTSRERGQAQALAIELQAKIDMNNRH